MLQLPVVTSLDGSEYAWVVQGGVDKRATVTEIGQAATFPIASTFVTLTATPSLPASRRLAIETNVLSETDGGAGSTVTLGVAANGIGDAKLRQGAALSVIGVTGNALANVADIAAGTDNQVLRRSGTALAFGAVNLASTNAVTGVLPFANGGIGIGAGTSGGIPYFSAATTIASSGLLTAGAIVLGGGVGATPTVLGSLGTTTTVLHGNAAGAPSFGAVVLTTDVSGILPVANGGTGLASGTSGGVLAYTASGTLASSAALTVSALVLGGGAGAVPTVLGSLGTTTTVLHGNAAGAPTFGAVSLTADVSGVAPVANGGTGQSTLTNHSVLIGASTAAISQTGVGATGTVLAGNTAADPTFQTVSVVLDNVSSTQGTVLYRGGATWSALAVGTDGQVLTTHGAASNPTWTTVAGTGTVTSITPGNGLTSTLTATAPGSAVTATGTLSGAHKVNLQTGTTYAITDSDRAFLVSYSNASAVAASIAQAGAANQFQAGWFSFQQNRGAGTVTLTPTTSTIDGVASVQMPTNTGFALFSDGSNYYTMRGLNTNYTITPQGRVTLQTATPVMSTTQSAKTTIYYTPYQGIVCPIYDGTNMIPTVFAELSNVTSNSAVGNAGPAAVANTSIYDMFVWTNAGVNTLTRGPAWTNDTTRSAGTALVMVQGIWLNNASITNGPAASRGTYVGSVRSNGSAQIDWIFGASGVAGFLGVWNMYNRVQVSTRAFDNTASWTYATNTGRQFDGSAVNQVSFLSGLAEDSPSANMFTTISLTANVGSFYSVGIGLDSTTAYSVLSACTSSASAASSFPMSCSNGYLPQIGFHYISANETGDGTHSNTVNGQSYMGIILTSRF